MISAQLLQREITTSLIRAINYDIYEMYLMAALIIITMFIVVITVSELYIQNVRNISSLVQA